MNQVTKMFEGEKIRIIEKKNEAWFVASDVCKVLDIKNTSQAINKLDDDERSMFNIGRQGYSNIVNEFGLYNLVLTSRKPEAKQFKRWITHEVLPSIRKTGMYMTDKIAQEITNNPEIIHFLAEQVAKINTTNNEQHEKTNEKLETIDNKIEGEYVTPQDLYAINYAIKVKSEKFVDDAGIQITIDTALAGDIYEQAKASKKEKEQRKYDIGKIKRKMLVLVKKHLDMKGNAPNNHIKRKDVDAAIQFIKNTKQRELN